MTANSKHRIRWLRYLGAMLVLSVLDTRQRLLSIPDRAVFRVIVLIFIGAIGIITGASLYNLNIARNIESLRIDSLGGLEAAAEMRMAVLEMQSDLLRQQAEPSGIVSNGKTDALRVRFGLCLSDYRRGVFDPEGQRDADRLVERFENYIKVIRLLSTNPRPNLKDIKHADGAVRDLTTAIEIAYSDNNKQLELRAYRAELSMRRALLFLDLLWWSVTGFLALMLLIYLVSDKRLAPLNVVER
jgi:hypothetical protein